MTPSRSPSAAGAASASTTMERTRSYVLRKKTSTPAGPLVSTPSSSSSSNTLKKPTLLPRSNSMFINRTAAAALHISPSNGRLDAALAEASGARLHPADAAAARDSPKEPPPPPATAKRKYKMREETKLLLKLHVIRTKAVSLDGRLLELQALTRSCQERAPDEAGAAAGRARADFLTKAAEIEHEVRLVKKLVLLLCRHRQLEKHYL